MKKEKIYLVVFTSGNQLPLNNRQYQDLKEKLGELNKTNARPTQILKQFEVFGVQPIKNPLLFVCKDTEDELFINGQIDFICEGEPIPEKKSRFGASVKS